MPIYALTVSQVVLVVATDESSAHETAKENVCELDWQNYDIEFDREIDTVAGLDGTGWDDNCTPYGGDGNTRLKALLPEA